MLASPPGHGEVSWAFTTSILLIYPGKKLLFLTLTFGFDLFYEGM